MFEYQGRKAAMPKEWEVISEGGEFELRHEGDFAPPTEAAARAVDAVWRRAVRRNPGAMHNGLMLAFVCASVAAGKTVVRCIRTEYKYYFAGVHEPELGFALDPVAVSGVIEVETPGGPAVLAARRGKTVTLYPGRLEFIPSGGIDESALRPDGTADFISQFRKEFTEETGLPESVIRSVEPFAFIRDIPGKVYDVCAMIRIDADPDGLPARLASGGEYSGYTLIPRRGLASFLEARKREFVPTSLAVAKIISKK